MDRFASLPPLVARDRALGAIEAIHACARVVAQEPDALELARGLATQLRRALRVETALVVAVIDEQITGSTFATSGDVLPPSDQSCALLALSDWVVLRRQLFLTNDVNATVAGDGRALHEFGWRQLLAVPVLHHQGQVIAVLVLVNRRDAGGFSAADVRLVETVSSTAAVGFDRATLLGQLQEWTNGMEALLTFSAAVNRRREPATLVQDMVEHAAQFLSADGGRGGVSEPVDAQSSAVQLRSHARWHAGVWMDEPRVWRRDEGLPGLLLETEFPLLVADYAEEGAAELALVGTVHRAICVPIKNHDGVILGFFELHRGEGRPPFTWRDASLLESLASTIAVAIDNDRLAVELSTKSDEIRLLAAHHLRRLEDERQHIARELHDEAGQALVGVKLSLQAAAQLVAPDQVALREQLDHLRVQLNEAASQLKTMARNLRPPTLDRLGLDMALAQLAEETQERMGCVVRLEVDWMPQRLSPEIETALFRVTQEALTNAAKHAAAREVAISLTIDGPQVALRIADNGAGFDVRDGRDGRGGLGLIGIRERIAMLEGELQVISNPGNGTTLVARVPIRHPAPACA